MAMTDQTVKVEASRRLVPGHMLDLDAFEMEHRRDDPDVPFIWKDRQPEKGLLARFAVPMAADVWLLIEMRAVKEAGE